MHPVGGSRHLEPSEPQPPEIIYKVARRTHTASVALPNAASRVTKEHMARSLVIVESPAKAKTINKYLGKNYTVKASVGHVMDLPTKTIGIRLPIDEDEINAKKKKKKSKKGGKSAAPKAPLKPISLDDPKIFEPTLQVIPGKGKVINDLRKSASTADAVYLAGDPDREGEAISAHLQMVLSKPAKFLIPDEEEEAKNGKNGDKDAKEQAEAAA